MSRSTAAFGDSHVAMSIFGNTEIANLGFPGDSLQEVIGKANGDEVITVHWGPAVSKNPFSDLINEAISVVFNDVPDTCLPSLVKTWILLPILDTAGILEIEGEK